MQTITRFRLLAILAAIPFIGFAQTDKRKQRIIDANPTSYYPFDDVATAANPLVGNAPLQFFTYTENKSPGEPGGEPGEAYGPYLGKGAVLILEALHVQVPNPSFVEGGERLRTYTLLYDFNYPIANQWRALFQGDEKNESDADIFIRSSDNALGVGTPGYATDHPLESDRWYRLVVTLSFDENGIGTETFYLDGDEIFTRTGDNQHLDLAQNTDGSGDRFSIGEFFWIFTDEDQEEKDISCAGFAFWAGRALTANEVAALGGIGYEGTPFAELPILSGKERIAIQAEDFDKGGSEVAYQVAETATNTYREEAVKIEAGPGDGNYHLVTGNGDWFNYSLFVPESRAGHEYIFWLYGQKTTGNYFNILVNGIPVDIATDVEFPTSYDEPVELTLPLTLKPGNNLITIRSTGGNLDKFEVQNFTNDYEGTPYSGEPFEIPGTFEAEHFDLGGEGVAYHDADETNSGLSTEVRPDAPEVDMETNTFEGEDIVDIGWTEAEEWLNYTVQVKEDGVYDITAVVATGNTNQMFYIDIDFRRAADAFVHTANHQTFERFSARNVPLTAGKHVMTFSCSGSVNIDKFIVSKSIPVQPQNIADLNPAFYYAFEKEDYSLPTIGNDPIEFYDLDVPGGPDPVAAPGPSAVKKAVTIQKNNYLRIKNPTPDADGQLINYSILFDIKVPKLGVWYSLYTSDEANSSDGNLWINDNPAGTLGWQNYSAFKLSADTWYRIVQTVREREDGSAETKVYVDGNLIHINTGQKANDKTMMVLSEYFWIFSDWAGYIETLDCSGLAFWGKTLTADEIYALSDAFHETPTAIKRPSSGFSGHVYAENGVLKVKGFSTTASLAVYNLLGQKITAYKSLNGDAEINLPAKGIYIVKVQDKAITSSYKVIVK